MLPKYKGHIYLALAASIWGGMYVISKFVLEIIQPLELLWLRYLIALITLTTLGFASHQAWKIQKKDMTIVIMIGIIGYFISIWAQFAGTKLSTAQMGAVITSSAPAFMVIFSKILLKEKITFKKAVSVALASIGVLLIIGLNKNTGQSYYIGGIILGIAAITWALMSVLVKKVPANYSLLIITTYAIFIAFIILTPIALADINIDTIKLLFEPAIFFSILYLGIVSTAVAFYLWNKGLQMVNASTGGLYFFFQPLVGTLLGWLVLGEQVGLAFWIGSFLIIGAVLLVIKE